MRCHERSSQVEELGQGARKDIDPSKQGGVRLVVAKNQHAERGRWVWETREYGDIFLTKLKKLLSSYVLIENLTTNMTLSRDNFT